MATAAAAGYTTISAQGGARSGKTYNILIWLILYALAHPRTRVSVVRATLPALRGSALVDFVEILRRLELYDEAAMNKAELVYTLPNGSRFEFFSTDSEQKLRGRKRHILFVNEANELSAIEWQQLRMRTEWLAVIDYNPSITDEHWICTLNKEARTYNFVTTYKDNAFLSQTIIDELESLKGKNASLWQIYGLGQQAAIEGVVFPSFEIVAEIPAHIRRRWIGVDYGFTHDPTAIVEVAEEGDALYIDERIYRTEMLTSDIIRELKACGALKVISESADPRLVREIYRAGVNIHAVRKFGGSVEAGIAKMHEYRLCVTQRSVNVIKELRNYTYQQDREGRWLNVPTDAWNHALDAVRYVVITEIMAGSRAPLDFRRLEEMAF